MHSSEIDYAPLMRHLQTRVPDLLAIYVFGSRASNDARDDSDLDMAVLVAGFADPVLLWDVSGDLANMLGCSVDLIDLRAATTVMQHQVITQGRCLWAMDIRAPLFEAAMLSEKTELDDARAGLIRDIETRGSVYGR